MKKSSKIVLLIIGFNFIVFNSFSQKAAVGNWFIYFGNQAINKKWNWHNEVQYRNYNFGGDLQQLILRTGIGYNLSENNNNLLLGYAYINTQRYLANGIDKANSNEHRLYQQFITKQNYNRFYIQHRYRIEERFLSTDFQVRARYFLSLNVPLSEKKMIKHAVYASAYNEIFLNTKADIFDRNRLYGGLGYVINKNLKAEIGFMAQTLSTSNRNQFQIIFFNNLPL
jgi:hypothetical protein